MASKQQVVKKVKYKTSVKDPGVPGVIKMVEERFVFMTNDPRSGTKLDVPFRSITGHKNTKEESKKPPWLNLTKDQGGSYIFEFESYSDLYIARDFVGEYQTNTNSFAEDFEDISML